MRISISLSRKYKRRKGKQGERGMGGEGKIVDNSFASKSARRPLAVAVGGNSLQLQCEMRENSSSVQIRAGGDVEKDRTREG